MGYMWSSKECDICGAPKNGIYMELDSGDLLVIYYSSVNAFGNAA